MSIPKRGPSAGSTVKGSSTQAAPRKWLPQDRRQGLLSGLTISEVEDDDPISLPEPWRSSPLDDRCPHVRGIGRIDLRGSSYTLADGRIFVDPDLLAARAQHAAGTSERQGWERPRVRDGQLSGHEVADKASESVRTRRPAGRLGRKRAATRCHSKPCDNEETHGTHQSLGNAIGQQPSASRERRQGTLLIPQAGSNSRSRPPRMTSRPYSNSSA